MGFAWVLIVAMIAEAIMLIWLRTVMRNGSRDFEEYLEMIDGTGEELPKVAGSRYSEFLERKQVTTRKELHKLLEEENVGEWSPYSLANVIRIVMLVCSVIASLLFIAILIAHPEFTEAHVAIMFTAYTGWFVFALYSGIIRVDKERSGIAVRALMRAGRIGFSALDLHQ